MLKIYKLTLKWMHIINKYPIISIAQTFKAGSYNLTEADIINFE